MLDVKPYVSYCDSIQEAAVPNWLMVMLHFLAIFNAAGVAFFFLPISNRFCQFDSSMIITNFKQLLPGYQI